MSNFSFLFSFLISLSIAASLVTGCASSSLVATEQRNPAGTGDVDSSSPDSNEASPMSYRLPLTREGKKSTRVAYNFWSGEWPMPIIDVYSERTGTTTIPAYTNLRNPTEKDKVSCTIKNGVYHPWSKNDPSAINYYSLINIEEFKVIKSTSYDIYSGATRKIVKVKIPKGALVADVIYHGENYCGATLKIGKTAQPINADCPFFYENAALQRTSQEAEFREQWLRVACEEKDASGKNLKAFIKDDTLLAQPGIATGCPGEYGTVGGTKACEGK